jgi:invasion protein IalB
MRGILMTLQAFVFAHLILLASTAGQDQFTSGVWQGTANYDEEGYFSDCSMTAQAEKDILLGFVMSKDLDWGLVIADETRSFEVGTRKAVLLIVDDHEPMPAVAKVVDVHGILIPLKSSDAVLDAMRHGKILRIASDQTEFSFQLTGTREAIAALAQCVTEHQGTNRVEL